MIIASSRRPPVAQAFPPALAPITRELRRGTPKRRRREGGTPALGRRGSPKGLRYLSAAIALAASITVIAADLPQLTEPINDFAHVVDPASARAMEDMIRALQAKTGDVVVVATVQTIEGYGTIEEYAVKLFQNHGRGIGQKGKDNGLLILAAMKERHIKIEVGYDLEQFVTDGFAGETSREYIAPEFRSGRYGAGLRAGVERVIGRIAQGRGVTLDGVRVPRPAARARDTTPVSLTAIFWIFIAILIVSRIAGGGGRRRRYWGGGPWSGWSSGVGPFGGGWTGGGFGGGGFGGGGGGFGGGFGGFGGGRSGGGGGGASW